MNGVEVTDEMVQSLKPVVSINNIYKEYPSDTKKSICYLRYIAVNQEERLLCFTVFTVWSK